jgi:hypothetical protein
MNSLRTTSKRTRGVRFRRAMQVLGATMGLLLLCVPLYSQANFGRISGTVTDPSGGAISGARVTVLDVERGVSKALVTNDAGEYNAPNLVPGNYKVRAESRGFKIFERTNILLEVGKEVRVDATLQPGEQSQTITVTESIPLVEITNATLGGTLSTQDISDLPLNGRNYQNLVSLRPGVMIQPGGGPWTQSTNNVRPDEMAWHLDGVLNANFWDSRPVANMPSPFTDAATILPVDAIQEFNTEENPKAEWGWKPGAVVNVGIKSGTNSLHGTAYAFGRSDAMDARNYFNPGLIGGQCLSNTALPSVCNKLPAELKQFGGVIGGPIKKDKLFFFAGYEGLRSLIGNSFTTNIPATASQASTTTSMVDALVALQNANIPISPVSLALTGCPTGAITAASTCTGGLYQNASANSNSYLSTFPNVNQSDNGIAKIDYHLNSKHTISGTFFIGNYTGLGEDHAFVNSLFTDNSPIRTWSNVETWIYAINNTTVNDLRFGYNRVDFGFLNNDANKLSDGKGYPLNTGVTNPGGLPNIYIAPFGTFGGGSYLGTNPNRPYSGGPSPTYDFIESLSHLKGKHALKFGGEFTYIEADSVVYASGRGRIAFSGGQLPASAFPCTSGTASCSTGLEDFFAGMPTTGQLLTGQPYVKTTWRNYAGYVQDDWRVKPRLTFNLGLRYSYTSPIKEYKNHLGSFDPNSTFGMVQQGSPGLDTLWKPDRKNFAPRFGFAWDITGKGTTVVRGGAGVMYSSFVLLTFLAETSFQNSTSTSLAAVPTGAQIITTTGSGTPGAVTTVTQGPGTIGLGTTSFTSSQLNWDPAIGGTTLNGGKVFPAPLAKCGDGLASATAGVSDPSPCNLLGVDPNLRSPYVTNWNLGVQHAFMTNLSLEVSYVGTHGSRLLGFRDLNQPDLATGVRPFAAKFPFLGIINWVSNDVVSNYHSLQTTLTKRTSHGLSFIAGYTYAHGLDNGSLNRYGLLPQNSANQGAEYGSSDFDVRHRFTLTTTYNIPGRDGFAQLMKGWQINSIINLQTGQPWLVSDSGFNFSGSGEGADRWDFFGNPSDFKSGPLTIPHCSGFGVDASGKATTSGVTCTQTSQFNTVNLPASLGTLCATDAPDPKTLATGGCYVSLNGKSAMTPPLAGTFGTMGRNLFRDLGFRNWDLSVFKDFTFRERFSAQFRVEVFNVLNHPLFANPYGASAAWLNGIDPSVPGTFGAAGGTPDVAAGNNLIGSGSARVLQLGLKLKF